MPGLVGKDFMFVFYHIYPLDLMDIYLDVNEPCCRDRGFVHLVTLQLANGVPVSSIKTYYISCV